MLLVIDVGNTNAVIGVYDGSHLIQNWRIRTERRTTEDDIMTFVTVMTFFRKGLCVSNRMLK